MRSMRWLLTILLLTTPVSGLAQRPRTGVPLEPTKPSQIVTLQTQLTPCPVQGTGFWLADTQTLPNGTTAPFPEIPPGQVLVLTGLSFVAVRAGSSFNRTQILLLNTSLPPSGIALALLFHSVAHTEGLDLGGGSAALHNAVIKPGTALCLGASDGFFVTGVISGFLAPDE